MEIVKFKKIGKSKYKIYFENEEITLYEDVILKYDLLLRKKINLDLLERVLESNKYYELYDSVLNYISIKMRSEKEIREYLLKKDAKEEDINNIVNDLYNKGLLNDKVYIESFINDSINLKDSGPFKIKNDLIKKEFNEEDIDEYLNKIDNSIWEEKIKKYINKHSNKKIATNMLKLKLLNDLNIKGYSKEMIYPLLENISLDDENNIKEEYKKIYKKYSSKYKGNDLKNKIINYLLRKGYNYSEINNIVK